MAKAQATTQQSWSTELNGARQQDRTSILGELREKLKKRGEKRGAIEEAVQKPSEGMLRLVWNTVFGGAATVIGFIFIILGALAYLNFHLIMYKLVPILGKAFCKFGEEGAFGIMPPPKQIKEVAGVAGDAGKEVAGAASIGSELAELIIVLVADLLIILVLLILITIICFVVWAIEDPVSLVATLGIGETVGLIKSIISPTTSN